MLFIALGRPLVQVFNSALSRMELNDPRGGTVAVFLTPVKHENVRIGDALELGTILSVRDQILRHLPAARRVVITAPAESLPELAHVLAVLLDRKLRADRVSCVLTCLAEVAAEGACVPTNIQEAVEVASDTASAPGFGVLVYADGLVHAGRQVLGADPWHGGCFRSHPGPVGELRGGQTVYFGGPPVLQGLGPTPSHGDDFKALTAHAVKDTICVWPITLSPFLPPDNLMVRLEGLVLAPPCGGDLPRSVEEHFAAKWTATLPIVVAMQCAAAGKDGGLAYAERKARLESRGFLVSGYESMSPAQARNLLVLRLSAFGWAGCKCAAAPEVPPAGVPKQGRASRFFKGPR